MEEIWKDIPGYEGFYQASTAGRIRSLSRIVKRRDGSQSNVCGRVLAPSKAGLGYVNVMLCNEAGKKKFYVHRLVLCTFDVPMPSIIDCRHLDGTKTNNAFYNLQWGTRFDNMADAINHGTTCAGIKHHRAKLDDDQIRLIRKDKRHQEDIANDYGVTQSAISNICLRKRWRHIE